MKNIAYCVERQHCTQDKFQSYICWMLSLGAIFAMIPPIILVMQEQDTGGCIGTDFVVYAHYSIHDWLRDKFEIFKYETNGAFNFDVCYELRIEDSALVDNVEPTIWIPETYVWIDIAEKNFRQYNPSQITATGKLIKNRTRDCTSTTNTPFGIITWKKFAHLLSPNGSTIHFEEIANLANISWNKFTNGAIRTVYPQGVESLYIAHGHPNVTSGGLLGFLALFNSLEEIGHKDVFEFEDIDECSVREAAEEKFEDVLLQISRLENHVISTAPIDYTLAMTMMSRGPEYLHMAFGFENDVALLNERNKSQLSAKWNDTLAFLYLEDTYWIEHPICKLTGADWYDDKKAIVADRFVEWISSTCTNCIADLEQHGLRPYNTKINQTSTIISEENGCNLDIKRDFEYARPTAPMSMCMRQIFRDTKKRTHITILLDVSGNMQNSIGDGVTRWKYVSDSLPLLPDNLEDSAVINLTCFHEFVLEGPGCSPKPYPNGTLADSRSKLKDYFANTIAPQIGTDEVSVFDSLLETYQRINKTQIIDPKFNYIIFVITEDDKSSGKKENAQLMLEAVGLTDDNPLQIRIYPILYYGEVDGITHITLEELAIKTNGQFATATADNLQNVITEFTYYW